MNGWEGVFYRALCISEFLILKYCILICQGKVMNN